MTFFKEQVVARSHKEGDAETVHKRELRRHSKAKPRDDPKRDILTIKDRVCHE